LIIECPYCDARVDANEVATYEYTVYCGPGLQEDEDQESNEWNMAHRATLLVCALCDRLLLATQEDESFPDNEPSWSEPERVFPAKQALDFPVQIPEGIRKSLEEARRCLRAEAYEATAVMCGKAIEGLCRHFKAGAYLGTALSELKTRGIIDGTLLQWGEELQRHRNIGAHAGEATIGKDDAADLFDFALAMCQYVFVLGEKLRQFRERTDPGGQCAATVQ
jgi:Domain of unknown function (DUF4145)